MPNLHLLTQTFSQPRQVSGTHQFNGAWAPLTVMLYIRFPLSLRNVEDLLHERGIEISYETVRFWWNRFCPKRTLQKFASAHASVHNHFSTERHLQNRNQDQQTRAAALAKWCGLFAA
jgi:transposase-like protein